MSKLYNTKFKPTKVGVIKFLGQKIGSLIKGKGKVSPTITKVKPSVGKTKLQKELSNIKKDHMKNMAPLDEAHSSLRQNIQRLKGEPVTKSGLSKGKDLRDKNKKMGGGMIGRRFGYKDGSKKSSLGMQSVKYGLDNNSDVTKADPKAKFIAAANKKKKKVV